jgi:hypothetical protein
MSNSYRIRTEIGVDKSIQVQLDQEYEFLEILSLKIEPNEIYTRNCADYGVIAGRVFVNNGFGLPNAKVSVFIPITTIDESDPVISALYPYKNVTDKNEDGYKYNLLPYVKSHSGHAPTGTFPDRGDALTNQTVIEVYDKYYKFTVQTNDSGDYMIFGVPVGPQTLVMNIDLSDIGQFSLTPQDLIRMGKATENQFAGVSFKSSNNLDELPQIVTMNKNVEVQALWGENDICSVGINRVDFDLSEQGFKIEPTAVFMGSLISSNDDQFLKTNCKPKLKAGNLCNLVTGPGQILAIRQTINYDIAGRPVLEEFTLDNGGKVIDENGAWLLDVPMNLDYVYTNEFGEQVLSYDPNVGIPTKAKYRFKVKWEQPPAASEPIKRGNFLVPNIKEYGWDESTINTDPSIIGATNYDEAKASYAFSLNWNDYGNTGTTVGNQMIQEAINCEDRFYEMNYNKIYTVSEMITQYRKGYANNRIISIKNILDEECESENNKFPSNDANYRLDIIFFLFQVLSFVLIPLLYIFLISYHILSFVSRYLLFPLLLFLSGYFFASGASALLSVPPHIGLSVLNFACGVLFFVLAFTLPAKVKPWFKNFKLPNLTYPDCELCDCNALSDQGDTDIPNVTPPGTENNNTSGNNTLSNLTTFSSYNVTTNTQIDDYGTQLLSGLAGLPTNDSVSIRTPQLQSWGTSCGTEYLFTSDLTLAERLNLFNTKAKYFDSSVVQGGGVNQIKVRFATDLNPIQSHLDNVIVILVNDQKLSSFTQGSLISFQNTELSNDPNVTNSITGTPLTNSTSVTYKTITYANPNGSGNLTTTYALTGDTNYNIYKFPIDVEYYQVITGMTYSEYITQTSNTLNDSLNQRILENTTYINYIKCDGCVTQTTLTPINNYNNYLNQGVIFLVRGVDPNSTRTNCEYDLSKLFGFNTWGNKIINGSFKLNIPIQGSLKNVKHDNIITNNDTDSYSNEKLFYPSYHLLPGTEMSGFTTNLPSYYSNLDNTTIPISSFILSDTTNGVKISSSNDMVKEWTDAVYDSVNSCYYYLSFPGYSTNNRGYYINEPVEGGSFMGMQVLGGIYPTSGGYPSTTNVLTEYYSRMYSTGYTISMNVSTLINNNIVMRSDRLPTSTSIDVEHGNSFPLHTNLNFSIYLISDDGTTQPTTTTTTFTNATNTGLKADNATNNSLYGSFANNTVIDSFSCNNLVPLSCYYDSSNTINIEPTSDACYDNGINGQQIMQNGCYVLVTVPILTIVKDLKLLTEWVGRFSINFGACRNVFGHMFTNNWINGTLYAFTFRNKTYFDSNNNAYSEYCDDVIFFDDTTFNYYYRSSPYSHQNNFIGSPAPNSTSYGGNIRNLLYPTTMLDLGPVNYYVNELTFSDNYDGYVANKLKDTTFSDVSELLNTLIISRLTNANFINLILAGEQITKFFSRHQGGNFIYMIDADYAQMNSINSELGVASFEPESYQAPNEIYYNGGSSTDGVFGIFYSSDTQARDYISPKRTILSGSIPSTSSCAFINFGTKSQEVPFYQWGIIPNRYNDNIFGSQLNDWKTNGVVGNSFFSYDYQSMDRLNMNSRYFRPNNISQSNYSKGYIYSVDSSGNLSASLADENFNTTPPRAITVGAPYHFYFGLRKGATAFDRFMVKWINIENNIQ